MPDRDEGALERAEGLFKKVLERVGASVDEKMSGGDFAKLPASAVVGLAAALEHAVEEKVAPDARGVRRIAPDRFQVLLTYEQNAQIGDAHRRALARELAGSVYEHIVNHRYATYAPVYVEVGADIFIAKTEVRAEFSAPPGADGDDAVREVRPVAGGDVRQADSPAASFRFVGPGGKPVVRARLTPGGPEAVTVGRSAGNRIVVDHHSVSKFHASVGLGRDGALVVSDLDSTNGTFVNDDPARVVGSRAAAPGDRIRFGDIEYRVERD